MTKPCDSWSDIEDITMAVVWREGVQAATAAVNEANVRVGRDKVRTSDACQRRVAVLRQAGIDIPSVRSGPAHSKNRHPGPTCISKPPPDKKPEPKSRKCLKCREDFSSEGNWNHVCKDCKQSSEWTSACLGVARL